MDTSCGIFFFGHLNDPVSISNLLGSLQQMVWTRNGIIRYQLDQVGSIIERGKHVFFGSSSLPLSSSSLLENIDQVDSRDLVFLYKPPLSTHLHAFFPPWAYLLPFTNQTSSSLSGPTLVQLFCERPLCIVTGSGYATEGENTGPLSKPWRFQSICQVPTWACLTYQMINTTNTLESTTTASSSSSKVDLGVWNCRVAGSTRVTHA